MKLYKTYLIKNLFKPLFVSLITLTAIVWSSRVIRFMDLVVQDGADFISFLKLTMLLLPPLMYVILPLTVFLTAILTYNKLIENREIIILKNCGITKFKLLSPLIILSVVITLVSYSISLYFSFKCNYLIRQTRQNIRDNLSFSMIKDGTFNKFKNLIIYCDEKDDSNIYNVMIYNTKAKNNENFILQAEKASLSSNYVILHNGNFQKFENNSIIPEILFFEKYSVNLDELTGEKSEVTIRIDAAPTRQLIEIFINGTEEEFGFKRGKVLYEICYRLLFPLICLLMALLSGSLMLQSSFNRMNGAKIMLSTSVISIVTYLLLLSLFQKISSSIVFLYVLLFLYVLIVGISLWLIRERNLKEACNVPGR